MDNPYHEELIVDLRAFPAPEYRAGGLRLFGRMTEGPRDARVVKQLILQATDAPTQGKPWEAACVLNASEAQLLMTTLWEAGVRPATGEGSSGQLAAVEKHLADMRQIAFAKINVPKP